MSTEELFPTERLDKKVRRLVRFAVQARKRAYAPYIKFRVGCALIDNEGRLHSGCNVQNVNMSAGLCAEQVAIAKMVSRGGREIETLVVASQSEIPAMPCGVCRQTMAEFCRELRIIAVNAQGSLFREARLSELLPRRFSRRDLAH